MNFRGAYGLGAPSGTMAAGLAANAEIFQFRWTDATNFMVPRSIRISAGGIVAFAAGAGLFKLWVARAWTADGTGGTAIVFAGSDQAKATAFATTLAPSNAGVRIASTAALGAGTKTLDTNAFAMDAFGVTATAGASLGFTGVLWDYRPAWKTFQLDDYPLVFAQNEGFVITATVPATGTWTFGVNVDWIELTSK